MDTFSYYPFVNTDGVRCIEMISFKFAAFAGIILKWMGFPASLAERRRI
jgi:hypothetical protein